MPLECTLLFVHFNRASYHLVFRRRNGLVHAQLLGREQMEITLVESMLPRFPKLHMLLLMSRLATSGNRPSFGESWEGTEGWCVGGRIWWKQSKFEHHDRIMSMERWIPPRRLSSEQEIHEFFASWDLEFTKEDKLLKSIDELIKFNLDQLDWVVMEAEKLVRIRPRHCLRAREDARIVFKRDDLRAAGPYFAGAAPV